MIKKDFIVLTPFKRWTLENFPFIEADFDAITNYQLYCKIVEYLNKVIANEKLLEQSNNELIDAFNSLKDYIDNYFETLDVQEEVNNKLDEMAESGQLTDIIAQYLGLAGVLAFNTISDMSDALNIDNGSICYCLGDDTYNDGKGGFYKIRTVTVDDTIDGFNIVALDVLNTLIAERIPNYYINTINSNIEIINSSITTINNNLSLLMNKKIVFIGDSYLEGYSPDGTLENWGVKVANKLGLSNTQYVINAYGGSGFVRTDTKTFAQMVNELTADNTVTDVIVCGGYNDKGTSYDNLLSYMTTFKTNCITKFPNAKIHVGHIGWSKAYADIYPLHLTINKYKNACKQLGLNYLSNVEYILKDMFTLISSDNIHPNNNGQNALANGICSAFLTGSADVDYDYKNFGITASTNNTINDLGNFASSVKNNLTSIMLNEIMNINMTTAIDLNCDGAHPFEIGTINDGYAIGTEYNTCVIPVTVILGYSGGYATATGTLSINAGKLYLNLYSTNTFNGANAFITYTGTYLIQIKGCNIGIDSTLC